MKYFVHYRLSDGKVLVAESWSFEGEPPLATGADTLLEVEGYFSPEDYYVENGNVVSKKQMDVSHSIEGLSVTFPYLPENTTVVVEGKTLITDSEATVIEFDSPGQRRIELVLSPQHLSTQLEVTLG